MGLSKQVFLPPPASTTDRWTARAVAESFCRGWVANIDSMSAVLGEKRSQRRFSYKANSRPISSHILSGDSFTFSPFSFPHTLSCICSPFQFILLKAKKAKKKEKKKQGRQRLSSEQSTEVGGGGTDSSPEDRPESPDVPQCR